MSLAGRKWWKERVFYQIYPLSFRDSNGDGLGDLQGITEKIPYLRELGIGGIWICPFYDAPLEYDYGYGPADLKQTNPLIGSMEDYRRLVGAAHDAGIKILLEWAATNTSIYSKWFKESRSSGDNARADWYHWFDEIPNNWVCYSGGSAWHYCPERNQYYLGLFFKEHAELNWRNPEVRSAVLDAFEFWVKTGIDGFRIDTIDMYVKDSGFRSNPPKVIDTRDFLDPSDPVHGSKYVTRLIPAHLQYEHRYDRGQAETVDIMKQMRAICDRHGNDCLLIGEVDIQTESGRELCRSGMSVAFNFSLAYSHWDAGAFRRALANEVEQVNQFLCCNTFSNHDVRRAISRFGTGDYGDDLKRAKVLGAIALTLKGVPMVYYGEEIGMPDVELDYHELRDPISLNNWTIGALRETSRGPMQWSGEPHGGFSSVRPWMKPSSTWPWINVSSQQDDPQSMLNLYKELIRLRNTSEILQYGDFELRGEERTDVLCYSRSIQGSAIFVVLNFADQHTVVDLRSCGMESRQPHVILKLYGDQLIKGGRLSMQPYDVAILQTS
jgi:alpha-glucosidase